MNGKRKILVVDDDAALRETMRGVLENAGYEVTTARNGCEAITFLARHDYDVVLLDTAMPKLDGLSVVGRLQKENSPVLAHTYLLAAGETSQFKDLPVCGVIGKPFDLHTLLAETKECIGH